ncbi:MAG: flagellar hook-basal body complex protein [Dorea sp.]|nr:flagellar hook-basal body complex protein [Dorea sp.]
MVRSMIAGVAGLKAHQSKLDVIGNNIANVNTWGFKSYSYNFQDAMYSNSIGSTGGSIMAGAAGGHNASQVGYGSTLSSISSEFETGAPSPSSNPMDCMIDGTGFFLVGNMVNGSFTNVTDSGLYLSRVGIFRVDNNGYLVDNQGSYVYGYALEEGTGIPEIPASPAVYTIKGAAVSFRTPNPTATPPVLAGITIGGVTVDTSENAKFQDKVQDWIAEVTKTSGKYAGYTISLDGFNENTVDAAGNPVVPTVNIRITANVSGVGGDDKRAIIMADWTDDTGAALTPVITSEPVNRVPGVAAEYVDELSAIRIPRDPTTGMQYDIQGWTMNEDGTIMGTDINNRAVPIAQLALVSVENPNGLEKQSGYYYRPGANSGEVEAIKPNGGPVGKIKSGWLEMANVDLANEFSNMITTQRGFQANSKIITVTDEMLQELVNMKR